MSKTQVGLNKLNPNIKNFTVVGILIAKSNPRTMESKKKLEKNTKRGVTNFTFRDSEIDTINCVIWGSEQFVMTLYEKNLIGDVVQVISPKLSIKEGQDEQFRPHVSSPFVLTVNEGHSQIALYTGDITAYLPLLHIPTKSPVGYCGLAEILKFQGGEENIYVDLLVVVKSVKPVKSITSKAGKEITVRSVEVMDNTTPAPFVIDMFDKCTIQRAGEWTPMESVLFVADARVSWRMRTPVLQLNSRSVVTHQPHTGDAEALRLYVQSQAERGGETAAWAEWSGERSAAATVSQIRERLSGGLPFAASLNAVLTQLNLDHIAKKARAPGVEPQDLFVRFSDHTGELSARLPLHVLEKTLGLSKGELVSVSSSELDALRWRVMLEHCYAQLGASPTGGLLVLTMRRATAEDPISLY